MKKYEAPIMEVVTFHTQDILETSAVWVNGDGLSGTDPDNSDEYEMGDLWAEFGGGN